MFILCLDNHLGRFDPSMVSDQECMELLTGAGQQPHDVPMRQQQPIQPVCEWQGVKCDADGHVTDINLYTHTWHLGTIDLQHLPPRIERCDISLATNYSRLRAEGTIETARLPAGLRVFHANGHRFCGTVDLSALPRGMTDFQMFLNELTGEIDLTGLPAKFDTLNLSKNKLSGSLCLERLPSSIRFLSLARNGFTGEIRLDALPAGMKYLFLEHNALSGSVDLDCVSDSMLDVSVVGNAFENLRFEWISQ